VTILRLKEHETAQPNPGSVLYGVRLDSDALRETADVLRRAGRISIDELANGLRVQSTSFVGRLQLGSLVITIEPKLAKGPLLALVRYAYGLRDVMREGTTRFSATGALLPDLLAAQLLSEVTELVARGLPRRYVERVEDLSFPRGRVDLCALARRGAPAVTIPCRHYFRSADHPLLRVLRGGLQLAADTATDQGLRIALRRLDSRLSLEISDAELTRNSVARARRALTRMEVAALPALELVELLLEGQAITLDDETTVRLPGFLFDMNRFFQALIGRFLRENLSECEVVDERALSGLLRYAPDFNPRGRRAPMPRPDFAVRKFGTPSILLDAKYRDLWERPLPREMLYQLAMYSTSGAGDSMTAIVYPAESASANEARIEIKDVITGGTKGVVALRPAHLWVMAELVTSPSPKTAAEARRLAFGP
jgi:5-methylcytosine-specific restriction enzyme subunit McrC